MRLPASRLFSGLVEPALAGHLPRPTGAPRGPTEAAVIVGLLSSPLGLGAAARLLAHELTREDVALRGVDVTKLLDLPRESFRGDLENFAPRGNEAVIYHLNPPTLIAASAHLPIATLEGKRAIGYWVWELEQAPRNWKVVGGAVTEIWAPSQFAADALRSVFPHHPVRVAPHPVALARPAQTDFSVRDETRAVLGAGADDFVVLTSFAMGSGMARKNPLASIAAFDKAFADRRDAVLAVRAREAALWPAGMELIRAAAARTRARVVVIDAEHSPLSLNALYAACDTYMSLHRSEGFGLNLAEAMLMGRPVIATAWSGNLDFMTDTTARLVPGALVDVKDPQRIYTQRARWCEPNLDAAVVALRALADDPSLRTLLGARGQALVQARLSGGAAAAALRQPAFA